MRLAQKRAGKMPKPKPRPSESGKSSLDEYYVFSLVLNRIESWAAAAESANVESTIYQHNTAALT